MENTRPSSEHVEAAVLRRLLAHLDERNDVQNIDLMNLGRLLSQLSGQVVPAAAAELGETVDYEASRERIYGMPYEEWKRRHQSSATPAQLAGFVKHDS